MPGAIPAGQADLTVLGKMGLNTDQAQFAEEFASKTGLSLPVVAAWELAEEPANSPYVGEDFNDWLNIDVSGAGPGSAVKNDPDFKSPISAADASAAWIGGKAIGDWSATPGIQSILKSASGSSAAQVAAINSSGWVGDSSGYPSTFAANVQHFSTEFGKELVPGGVPDAVAGAASGAANSVAGAANSVAGAVTGPVQAVEQVWSAITNPSNWLRALEVLGAVVAIYLAVKSLTGTDPTAVVNSAPVQAAGAVKKARRAKAVEAAAAA